MREQPGTQSPRVGRRTEPPIAQCVESSLVGAQIIPPKNPFSWLEPQDHHEGGPTRDLWVGEGQVYWGGNVEEDAEQQGIGCTVQGGGYDVAVLRQEEIVYFILVSASRCGERNDWLESISIHVDYFVFLEIDSPSCSFHESTCSTLATAHDSTRFLYTHLKTCLCPS